MTWQSEPPAIRRTYAFKIHSSEEGDQFPVVIIVDFARDRSLPGDADAMLADVAAQGINLMVHGFLYRDRSGWYELEVDAAGTCTGLRILHTRSEREALENLRSHWQAGWDAIVADVKEIEWPEWHDA